MELQKGSLISYELSFISIIEQKKQVYLKIDTVKEIKENIIITNSYDKISIKQIIKNIKTKELNPLYISNFIID